jgi:hypothetical protein
MDFFEMIHLCASLVMEIKRHGFVIVQTLDDLRKIIIMR